MQEYLQLSNLPLEIYENIYSYLDNNDLKNLQHTCKLFHDIIYSSIKRGYIYNKPLYRCYICQKNSIKPLPMLCTFWKKEGVTREIDICSKYCKCEFMNKLPFKCFCMILCLRYRQ